MMHYFCQGELLFDVPPESFDPIPKVMSAIIRLIPHEKPPVHIESFADFNQLVTAAFSQRRKTIRNSLSNLLTEAQIAECGINPSARAETLPLEAFAMLSNFITQNRDNLPQ